MLLNERIYMKITRVLCIEDSITKFMDVQLFLKKQNVKTIDWARDSEKAIELLEKNGMGEEGYDLIVSDMHFEFEGENDLHAGEKLLSLIREKGYDIPVIFCSSQNWMIEGAAGNIFYNENRDWQIEAEELFRNLRKL